jgi:dTDP-4-dehydrorhamnose reductase
VDANAKTLALARDTVHQQAHRTSRRAMLESSRREDVPIKILLIGAAGQVGRELRRALLPLGEITATDRTLLDLDDETAIRRTIRAAAPALIVNAAAYTQVDPAEAEPELAMAVNGRAPGILAQEAERSGAALVHYSTDYVFSGAIQRPYREDDAPDPINVYGATKLAGERAIAASGVSHLILRTSWVFGPHGKNFFSTILALAREREELKVVDDQIGKPNWSRAVAEATAQILLSLSSRGGNLIEEIGKVRGIYHVGGNDHTSRYGFAEETLALYRRYAAQNQMPPLRVKRLIAVPTSEFPSPARRPLYSVLSAEKMIKTFAVAMPGWQAQLALALGEMPPADAL